MRTGDSVTCVNAHQRDGTRDRLSQAQRVETAIMTKDLAIKDTVLTVLGGAFVGFAFAVCAKLIFNAMGLQ
jgi:hypothetical protein